MYYRTFLIAILIALSLEGKSAQPKLVPSILAAALSETIPVVEEIFFALELNTSREEVETLLGKSVRVEPAAQVSRAQFENNAIKYVTDDRWSFPERTKCVVTTHFKLSGKITIKCYFNQENRLIWKAADVVSSIGQLQTRSESELKRSLQWAFTHQDGPDIREVRVACALIQYYSFGDVPAGFERTEQRENVERLKGWALSEAMEPYGNIFRDVAQKMLSKLSVDENSKVGSDHAEIFYRVTGSAAFAFWDLRSKTLRKVLLEGAVHLLPPSKK